MEKLDTLCRGLLDSLNSCTYSRIKEEDYTELIKLLSENTEKAPYAEELRLWVYWRVAEDVAYRDTNPSGRPFCIGILYGIFKTFDTIKE